MAEPETYEEYRARQDHDWSQYIAVEPITHNGVLAFNPGDAVPVSNVKAHKYDERGLVAKTTTKAAANVKAAVATEIGV